MLRLVLLMLSTAVLLLAVASAATAEPPSRVLHGSAPGR